VWCGFWCGWGVWVVGVVFRVWRVGRFVLGVVGFVCGEGLGGKGSGLSDLVFFVGYWGGGMG